MTRIMITAAAAAILTGTAACSGGAGTDSVASAAFRDQLQADWKYWMTEYPELATSVGYPGVNDRWTDYSPAAIDRRNAYLRSSAEKLAALDRASLTAVGQTNYDLFRDIVGAAVEGLTFNNDAVPVRSVIPHNLWMPMNQLEGIQQDIPNTITSMPTATAEDFDNLIKRIGAIGPLVDQTIALMKGGLARGLTPPKITFRDVPSQVTAQIVADPLKSPLLEAFLKFPAAIAGGDRAGLVSRATNAYKTSARPAFERLHEFLIGTYLPGCRDTTGVRDLKAASGAAREPFDAAAMYTYNVKWHTTTDKTPQQIHDIGLAEVKRIRGEMDTVIADAGFRGSYEEFKTFLRTSPQFYFKDAATLLAAYRDVAKRADPQLAHLFGRLPQTPYGVSAVPDASAPSQTTAYYNQGSFVAGRPGTMFANTYRLDMRPRWEMEALTMHEAVPGHHLQIGIAQELAGLPEFRKFSSYTAFVEGWALYSESLGYEMGFYTDPYSKFGQLTYDMWRAVRLVVDTGMHALGWTRQQAIDFFKENAAKTEQDITVEVDRYIVWPGQALGYKMGQLKIRELRTEAERTMGARFDVRGFHDAVLGQGAVPLDVLEKQVKTWMGKS